jgi:serine phosphatase RsbU (regulator of sigma subunit)
MKRLHHLWTFILIGFACACNQPQDNSDNTTANVEKNNVNWSDSARSRYMKVAYYYNNNIHDSLVMAVPAERDFCKEHELWTDYYDVWMLLGEEYNFSGEHSKAIDVAQEIHDDAAMRNNGYGLAAAEFIKALVYDSQLNHEESARSFEQALKIYPDSASSFLKNSIYVYYTYELRDLKDSEKMQRVLDEWKAYIDICRQDTTIPPRQFDNWLYYYHHSCYFYYLNQKDLDKAEQHVDSVVMHLDRQGWSQVTRNEVLGYRVQLAIARKNFSEALKLNDQQLPGAEELDINAYSEILKQRAIILSNIGQWKEAYNYLDQHYELVDSINQAETRQQLNELNKRFEIDELRAQQEREKLQHEHEKIENERQRMYLLSIFGAFVVVGVIIVIILRQRTKRRLTALKAEQERMESELSIARDIQMSMVPSTFPQRERLDMYATMMPAREVGGDLYGYVIHDDLLYFCLGDVSGKGVPASLFMAQATRMFQSLANQGLQPAEICTQMNDALSGKDNKSGMFITFFVGLINLQNGHLSFCNAGHNPPVIINQSSRSATHFLKMEANAPLGLWTDLKYVGEEMESIKGQPLFIYTDGLNEAENHEQQQFGEERLLSILRNTHFNSSKQIVEALAEEAENHRNGAEPNDDLTMMCIWVA